jgi:hypothetical protein
MPKIRWLNHATLQTKAVGLTGAPYGVRPEQEQEVTDAVLGKLRKIYAEGHTFEVVKKAKKPADKKGD